MSLILDALRKAEEDRKRGTTAGGHASALFTTPPRRSAQWQKRGVWIVLLALASGLAGGVWYGIQRESKPAVASVTAAPEPASPPMKEKVKETVSPAPPVARPAPTIAPTQESSEKSAPAEKKAQRKTAEPTQPLASASASASETPVPTLRELPEQIQREIPPLEIGGYIYSGNKADRTVIVNKRLSREGDEIAPGLVLEKMLPNGMVLNYRGYRYRASY